MLALTASGPWANASSALMAQAEFEQRHDQPDNKTSSEAHQKDHSGLQRCFDWLCSSWLNCSAVCILVLLRR